MAGVRAGGPKGDAAIAEAIAAGASSMSLGLDETAVARLAALVALLARWNRVYNLTAVREPREMVTRHILDSLAVLPYLEGGRLLDVGTGAGLPGLPLAIARPELAVTLLDSSEKKLRFVRQAAAELGLAGVDAVHARMEAYQPAQPFDMVISRAVSSLAELYRMTRHLLDGRGRWLFMKGTRPDAELADFAHAGAVRIEPLTVAGLDAERHLLILDQRQLTD